MKITYDGYILEGSPEELAEFLRGMDSPVYTVDIDLHEYDPIALSSIWNKTKPSGVPNP